MLPADRLSVQQIAAQEGVSEKAVYGWLGAGVGGVTLASFRVGGRIFITPEALRQFHAATNGFPAEMQMHMPGSPFELSAEAIQMAAELRAKHASQPGRGPEASHAYAAFARPAEGFCWQLAAVGDDPDEARAAADLRCSGHEIAVLRREGLYFPAPGGNGAKGWLMPDPPPGP